jgi:hypothetical protein
MASTHAPPYYLTKYEYCRIRGYRLEQLVRGGIPFVSLLPSNTSPEEIFEREFHAKNIPVLIRRLLPNGQHIDIQLQEMNISLLDRM